MPAPPGGLEEQATTLYTANRPPGQPADAQME